MQELEIVEREKKNIVSDDKCQIQVKNRYGSRSFTIKGIDIDYLFEVLFLTMKKICTSETNEIKLVCYKPPK